MHNCRPNRTALASQSKLWDQIVAQEILLQHVKIRPGDEGKSRDGSWDNLDALQLNSGARNVVIDHVSASWAVDENISVWADRMDNVTISNCIISEGLHNSVHTEQPHSKGLLIGPHSGHVAIIANLMAHNFDRVPQIQGGSNVFAINNLVYEGGRYNFVDLTDPYRAGPINAYFASNLFIDGPSTSAKTIFGLSNNLHPDSRFFQQNNLHLNRLDKKLPVLVKDKTLGIQVDLPPVSLMDITVIDVELLEPKILKNAGARPAERRTKAADPVDKRIVHQVKNRTGKQVDCVQGCANAPPEAWPSSKPVKRFFAIPVDPHGDWDGDGYSNIEEVLHRMASQVEN
ncbi:MAG: hypothetical protein R2864_13990 [Syntrophotaleaceae bacterium]